MRGNKKRVKIILGVASIVINNKERIEKLKEDKYQRVFGVKKPTFDKILDILEKSCVEY